MHLKDLKDQELEASFQRVVATERKVLHAVILHIQEVSRRKLYLARGYSSLFSYLTSEMKYSNAAAQRRIDAARIASAVPSVVAKIESGEINLSQLSDIQRAVKSAESLHQIKVSAEVKSELIAAVEKRSTTQTQQLCAEILDIPVMQEERIKTQKDHSKRLETSLTLEQYAKFEKVKGKLAHKHFQTKRSQSIADVLETIFDEIIAMHEPPAKKAAATEMPLKAAVERTSQETTIQKMKPVTSAAEMTLVSGIDTSSNPASEMEAKWNSLTPKRKKIILNRDRCCQFRDHSTGKVCASQFQLEVDHIQPKWTGGSNDASNLQALCRRHNQFRYRHDKVRSVL